MRNPRRRAVPRGLGLLVTLVMTLVMTLTCLMGAPALAAGAHARSTWSLASPFARESVHPGAKDKDPWHIEHVYDVQYRLRWLGLIHFHPDGVYGPATEKAVAAFQKAHGLTATGSVNHATWPVLIRHTIRGKAHIPSRCHSTGWHFCYDRLRHQATLFHHGHLYNAWLVRGGGASTPTRLGRYPVYWRDINHVSTLFANAPMPYAQFFSGGEAVHGSRFMVDPFVEHSHGCVNMWVKDARALWRVTAGHRLVVHVYGRWS